MNWKVAIKVCIFVAVLVNNVSVKAGDLQLLKIYDGSHFSVKQFESCDLGDCKFYIPEIEETYYIDNGYIYVMSTDRQKVRVYEKSKHVGVVDLSEFIYLPMEFVVSEKFMYVLTEDGFVNKLSLLTGDTVLKSNINIVENDIGILSDRGYKLFLYQDLVAVKDVFKEKLYCFKKNVLKRIECPSNLTKIKNEEYILEDGSYVTSDGNWFCKYSNSGSVAGNVFLDKDALTPESRWIGFINGNGVYIFETVPKHRHIIYHASWEPLSKKEIEKTRPENNKN